MKHIFILALIIFAVYIIGREPGVIYITLAWLIPAIFMLAGIYFTEEKSDAPGIADTLFNKLTGTSSQSPKKRN